MTSIERINTVSVCVITYNHEKYIKQSLDSILNQETKFNFEIIIGEDCSTDSTREIVLSYKEKFPEKIKLLLNPNNIGMIPNFINTLNSCSGKYIALCEGDDYWIDNNKLQKQVDFLEANLNYSLCFHNALVIDERIPENKTKFNSPNQKYTSTINDVIKEWFVASASILFRSEFLKLPDWFKDIYNGDYALQLLLADKGPFGYINETMSVYNKNLGGMNAKPSSSGICILNKHLDLLNKINIHFSYKYSNLILTRTKSIERKKKIILLRKKYPFLRYVTPLKYYKKFKMFINH